MNANFRLWQRVLHQGVLANGDGPVEGSVLAKWVVEVVRRGTVAVVDHGACIYCRDCESKKGDATVLRDDAVCEPPLSPGFYEAVIEKGTLFVDQEAFMVGVAVHEVPKDRLVAVSTQNPNAQSWIAELPPESRVYQVCLVEAYKGPPHLEAATFVAFHDGQLRGDYLVSCPYSKTPLGYDAKVRIFTSAFAFSWALMHCKNVTVKSEKVSSEHDKRKLKALAREGRAAPKITIKTLEIDAFKEVVRTQTEGGESGIKKALHLCRGHFRTYDPETSKGLFGRGQFGQFWVPQHMRGDEKVGVVEKDYKLKAE